MVCCVCLVCADICGGGVGVCAERWEFFFGFWFLVFGFWFLVSRFPTLDGELDVVEVHFGSTCVLAVHEGLLQHL